MIENRWEVTREMFLDEKEVSRLLQFVRKAAPLGSARDAAAAKVDQLIVETLLFSGLRNSEFCGLLLADMVEGRGGPAFVVRGPGKEQRTVFIPAHLCEFIKTYIRQTRPSLLPKGVNPRDPDQPLVFNERGGAYERTGLYRRVVRILTAAGLGERASVQLLRHTYGYLAYLRTGGNLLFVQRQLGHAHPMVTVVYAKFVEEDYGGMADLVGTERSQTRQQKESKRR